MTEAEISKIIRHDLESLEMTNDIIWFERLNSGKIQTIYNTWMQLCRRGTPDYVCVTINRKGYLSVIFIEAKRSEGGRMSHDQIKFCDKMSIHPDTYYMLINDPSTLKRQILDIAEDKVAKITLDI